jgi:gamma-glutamyltranspeptidase/glutathione hydrolase
MVTSPHSLASAAGVDVLRAGGSAIDAIIAASGVLGVIYPHMTGIGGDAFWLIHDGKTGQVRYIDGGGRAAAGATIPRLAEMGHGEIPLRGIVPATLTTPGALASWSLAHDEYGRLPLSRVLESAIGYARDGFPVTQRLSDFTAMMGDELAKHPESAKIFLPGGEVPAAGSMLRNGNLAHTLECYARDGRNGFYEGDVAQEMARFAARRGGFFSVEDLAAQQARWGQPLVGTYRDVTIYNTPAPTQGFTVLEMLNLLEPLALRDMPMLSAERLHLLVQAKQIAFNDRDQLLADPDFVDVPIDRLISKSYADQRAKLLDPSRALPWDKVPSYGSLNGDTVYLAAIDGDGNAVSLIQSVYGIYGSTVVAGETGVLLQNRGAYFSLDPDHPNSLEPGKCPLHTLIASIAMRDDRFWGVLGCMGADGQPQIQVQCYLAMIDYGLDIQEAVEMPRFISGRVGLGEARDTLQMEARFPPETYAGLEKLGHQLDRWGDWNEMAGHAHGIFIDPQSGARMGGADPRSDGAAIGC